MLTCRFVMSVSAPAAEQEICESNEHKAVPLTVKWWLKLLWISEKRLICTLFHRCEAEEWENEERAIASLNYKFSFCQLRRFLLILELLFTKWSIIKIIYYRENRDHFHVATNFVACHTFLSHLRWSTGANTLQPPQKYFKKRCRYKNTNVPKNVQMKKHLYHLEKTSETLHKCNVANNKMLQEAPNTTHSHSQLGLCWRYVRVPVVTFQRKGGPLVSSFNFQGSP